jgi:cellulose biosynthesis protein BcsQ
MLTKPLAIAKHFHKLAIQLEVKGSVKLNSVVVFSSFDVKEGKSYNAIYLAAAFAQQGKSVLVVDADGNMHANHNLKDSVNLKYENIAGNITRYKNTEIITEQLNKWKEEYDLVIIKNEPLNDISIGLIMMSLADTNLFVLDSRRTAAKMIAEAEALNDEYKFNNMQFLLNRSGYNPNIAIQAFDIVKALVLKLKRTPTQA